MASTGAVMETLYTSPTSPDEGSALDVLAFLLTTPESFATAGVPPDERAEEIAATRELLDAAKTRALIRWYEIQQARRSN